MKFWTRDFVPEEKRFQNWLFDKFRATAISFGRLYMTNPDLVERFEQKLPLAELPPQEHWFEPSDKTRADLSWGYTQYGAHGAGGAPRAKVLHLVGSPTSGYYEKLSLMYAQGCAAANEEYCEAHG